MRKLFLPLFVLLVAGFFLSVPATKTSAQASSVTSSKASDFQALAPIPGLTDQSETSVVKSQDLSTFFNNLYKYLIGLAAAFAVIEIIWGGIEISTQDSVSKQTDGKARIQQALYGLVLVLSPVLVFSIINPSILNLSLNLPKLDTATKTGNDTASAGLSSTQCTVLHTGQYLESARCPTKELAAAYKCQNTSLTLHVNFVETTCKSFNPNTKVCDDGFSVECQGPSISAVYYYTLDIGTIYNSKNSDVKIIPRDAPIESSFTEECSAEGGQVQSLLSTSDAWTGATIVCPADAQLPTYDQRVISGIECIEKKLQCRAK